MRIAFCILCISFISLDCVSQVPFRAIVKDSESGATLPGATAVVQGSNLGGYADEHGIIEVLNIADGEQKIKFSFVGYETLTLSVTFPLSQDSRLEVLLTPSENHLEEIIISSTRSSRTIADIPTRVEFIAGEELDEKANMKPGDIRMVLSESTGIQVQQTSATSANASIRIQGLDGRYTQILKDGLPLYAGFSAGLGLLQTPPLDLKQVEVIKGSSSTLYGGGAIAGMVNLISRTPTDEQDLRFFINGTTAKGLDVSGFYGKKFGKTGITVFGSRNSNAPYDPADIDLTAIPKFERYTINPKLFVDFDDRTHLNIGFNFTTEDRLGGDIHVIEGNGDATHRYFEDNTSRRFSTQLSLTRRVGETSSVNLKNSINRFRRDIATRGYLFEGTQTSTFTEVNYITNGPKSEWISGLNLFTDNFSEVQTTSIPLRNYAQITLGAFVQNTLSFSDKVSLESGLRGDYVKDYGFAWLPRLSLLYKISPALSTRIGGGLGYKSPTIFTEESERIQYQNVLPISADRNKLEKSYGANWDFNYRTELGEVGFSINQLFFYTHLSDPLFLSPASGGYYSFVNIDGYTQTQGTETNIKLEYEGFKLFVGYTFTDTRIHQDGTSVLNPLTARHRLNSVLMYELDEKWKAGFEAYYFSKQRLTDNSYGKEYWILGLMVERLWEKFSVFINFENFLDARQTRFDTIYTGTITNPVFRDIYAPLDGFVINGGLKLRL